MLARLLVAAMLLVGCPAKPEDTSTEPPPDADADGFPTDVDCDDGDPAVHPGGPERCNGIDDDCDGFLDEEDPDLTDGLTLHPDADGDGWGSADPAPGVRSCEAVDGWVEDATDCDDADPDVHPGAQEVCNGADEDCDGQIDEDGALDSTWYRDEDGDGWGTADDVVVQCVQPSGYTLQGGDCDDALASVHPGADEHCDGADEDCDGEVDEGAVDAATWYADDDGDGFGDARVTAQACAAPRGYVADATDCDDDAASVHPGAEESCDGVDQDCDGTADEGAVDAATWYADADGDGFGDAGVTARACAAPLGYVADATDCDDGDPAVHPTATERCDGIDQDCDGVPDDGAVDFATWYGDLDGDGYGDAGVTTLACTPPSGFVADATDCDDGSASVHPGAAESCDGIDEDCDGSVDDGAVDAATWYADADGDSFGAPGWGSLACTQPAGTSATADDCDDADAGVHPGAPETCDGVDQDCDGGTDEDALDATAWYADLDGDGYGDPASAIAACGAPTGTVADDTDCDDGDADVHPGAAEHCDGVDEDCDGGTDEGAVDAPTWYSDDDGDGYGDASAGAEACAAPSGTVADATDCDDGDPDVHPGATEHCDGVDEDCDGALDDHAVDAGTWYSDDDGDGYGDASAGAEACAASSGTVADATDCDDGDPDVHPGATEHCDGVDEDCDGAVDGNGIATFVSSSGVVTDYTAAFATGTSSAAYTASLASSGTLTICPGTYRVEIQARGADLSIVGLDGSGSTALLGDGTGSVIAAYSTCADLSISGLTLEGGGSVSTGGGFSGGTHGLDAVLEDVVVQDCAATWGGGVYQSGGSLVGLDIVVQDCAATNSGGGLYLVSASLSLTGADVSGNDAGTYYGGGLYCNSCSSTLDNAAFDGNTAVWYGGGVYLYGGSASLTDGTIDANESEYGGGGLFVQVGAVSLSGCEILDNVAAELGGGLYATYSSASMDATAIRGNTASGGTVFQVGGGVLLNNTSDLTCVGSIDLDAGIYDNDAGFWGGGVLIADTGSTLTSTSCDWGNGWADNSPNDVAFPWSTTAYRSYHDDETFTCTSAGCS